MITLFFYVVSTHHSKSFVHIYSDKTNIESQKKNKQTKNKQTTKKNYTQEIMMMQIFVCGCEEFCLQTDIVAIFNDFT